METAGRHRTRDRGLFALIGFFLGLGAPVGWLFFRALVDQPAWVKGEFSQFGDLYLYLTAATVIAFMLFGYAAGRRSDRMTDRSVSLEGALQKTNRLAVTDALTNIHNARYLHDQMAIEIESAKRYDTPLSCLMLDIDDFKSVNDRFGHPLGDTILATIAKLIQQSVRRVDIVGRLGGEEFLVMMPHTASDMAFQVAERIRQTVERSSFRSAGIRIPITVSIGIACFPMAGVHDKMSLMKATDVALYEAKHAGKNRTVAAESDPSIMTTMSDR